jgi:hypothetical protein
MEYLYIAGGLLLLWLLIYGVARMHEEHEKFERYMEHWL